MAIGSVNYGRGRFPAAFPYGPPGARQERAWQQTSEVIKGIFDQASQARAQRAEAEAFSMLGQAQSPDEIRSQMSKLQSSRGGYWDRVLGTSGPTQIERDLTRSLMGQAMEDPTIRESRLVQLERQKQELQDAQTAAKWGEQDRPGQVEDVKTKREQQQTLFEDAQIDKKAKKLQSQADRKQAAKDQKREDTRWLWEQQDRLKGKDVKLSAVQKSKLKTLEAKVKSASSSYYKAIESGRYEDETPKEHHSRILTIGKRKRQAETELEKFYDELEPPQPESPQVDYEQLKTDVEKDPSLLETLRKEDFTQKQVDELIKLAGI